MKLGAHSTLNFSLVIGATLIACSGGQAVTVGDWTSTEGGSGAPLFDAPSEAAQSSTDDSGGGSSGGSGSSGSTSGGSLSSSGGGGNSSGSGSGGGSGSSSGTAPVDAGGSSGGTCNVQCTVGTDCNSCGSPPSGFNVWCCASQICYGWMGACVTGGSSGSASGSGSGSSGSSGDASTTCGGDMQPCCPRNMPTPRCHSGFSCSNGTCM